MDKTGAIILGASLFIIMFGMGLSLSIDDFKRVFKFPKAVFIGVVNQLVLLPIIGFTIASVLNLEAEIAVGIMILAACPGGATSNLIAHLAKGDTALSVTLTAVSSLITIITIPFIVNFALIQFLSQDQIISIDVIQTIGQLVIIIILPVALGMLVNAKANNFARKMDKTVRIASAFVLGLVIVGIIIKEKSNVIPYFQQAGIAALLLNIVTMSMGYLSSRAAKLSIKQSISIAIESGIQNGTLAITIATITLGNTKLAIAGAIYSLIMFFTGTVIVLIRSKNVDQPS